MVLKYVMVITVFGATPIKHPKQGKITHQTSKVH